MIWDLAGSYYRRKSSNTLTYTNVCGIFESFWFPVAIQPLNAVVGSLCAINRVPCIGML